MTRGRISVHIEAAGGTVQRSPAMPDVQAPMRNNIVACTVKLGG